MSTLTVRNLDEDLKIRLRLRAAANGRSMEAEARAILRESLEPTPQRALGTRIHQRLIGLGFADLEISPRADPPREVNFGE